ncbi:MAG: undecaprenyl-diphosphatase UppP [Thermostichales cyanobacterium SZTDM-1c_bins_54]
MGIPELGQALLLGAVQGITEFLPISSTAHLLLLTRWLGWTTVGEKFYVDAIQFGSVIAVLLYFAQDIRQILLGSRDPDSVERRLLVGIGVGTLPALIVGYLIQDHLPDQSWVIGSLQIVMALLLAAAERWGSRKRTLKDLRVGDGFWVGLGQTVALLPGASRSGCTLTAALALGLERAAAARFAFLLGIPTLTIATLYQSRRAFGSSGEVLLLLTGIGSAFVFSYLAIAWLLRFLQHHSTRSFIIYRILLGIGILLAQAF